MLKLLQSLQYSYHSIPYYSQHLAPEVECDKKTQLAIGEDNALWLSKKENTLVRQIIRSVFFFAHVLDLTLLLPTNELFL